LEEGTFDWLESPLYTKEAISSSQQYQESQQARMHQFYSNLHKHDLVCEGTDASTKDATASLSSAFDEARWTLEVLWSELNYPRRQRETFSEANFQQLTPKGYTLVVGQITSLSIVRSRLIQILRLIAMHRECLAKAPGELNGALLKLTLRIKEQIGIWLEATPWVSRFVFSSEDYMAVCERALAGESRAA
jgi:hypothetical protein